MNQMTAHPPMPVHDLPMAGCLVGRCISVTTTACDIAQTAAGVFAHACQVDAADASAVLPCVSGVARAADGGRSDH